MLNTTVLGELGNFLDAQSCDLSVLSVLLHSAFQEERTYKSSELVVTEVVSSTAT